MRFVLAAVLLLCSPQVFAQSAPVPSASGSSQQAEIHDLRVELARLSARLDALERQDGTTVTAIGPLPPSAPSAAAAPTANTATTTLTANSATATPPTFSASSLNPPSPAASAPAVTPAPQAVSPNPALPPPSATAALDSVLPTSLPGGATLNYTFDGYYEYNFNQPPGRVNDLRAYDVLSNTFSINQADMIFDLLPDLEKGRRFGFRVDLQFGQATETLQGNGANEPRPEIYRNIFQAYGTYVVPVGKGLQLDFGKWASSLGYEGNYTKDQMNYTRSFYFYYLPFYHQGVRASYHVNDKLALNYWVVNGTNQSEPTNGYKDELFGFVLTPTKTVTWTSNYYLGQEHPNTVPATNCTIPVQPGLCVAPINPAPNGKLHIFDNYVTWQARPKLTFTAEGDYVIEREWAKAAPGESSAPSHVIGGVGYAQYQLNPQNSLSARAEYLSDRGGLFSGTTQALKEVTGTYKHTIADGLDAFIGFRRDWSSVPYFTTHNVGAPSDHQTTATLGLVWWYGGKQGSW